MSLNHHVVFLEQALLQFEACHKHISVHDMAVAETREGQLLGIVDATAVTAHHVRNGCRHVLLAEQHSAIDHGLQVCGAGQWQRHAPTGRHFAEADVAFPLGKIISVVGITCLGSHTCMCEVPMILGVVLCTGMVIEIVLVFQEFADAVRTVQNIIVVLMLPCYTQVNIEVERVK